ncbi:putative membrane protein [Sinobacterium caligoides]|uniref:Protoporphyrinogen IX oxidase n=1 Tax=Sinobacterium caligoides TaxID=933926 RepID=A0A3N2DGD0_9GAMM|nr:protoporphyrinogen oxidase HemJ [Sinobacterium caligoides]ROR98799.1 putative membrane protein [Sinobacterium caligoides]
MLWIKALHIFFMVAWFAGIFYLPRLFVNHAMVNESSTSEQLKLMERKLYRFITPFMVLTIACGFWLVYFNPQYYFSSAWFHAKLCLVLLLVIYHFYCGKLVKDFAADNNQRSHVFYRVFNEIPVLILIGAIVLVVVRPF